MSSTVPSTSLDEPSASWTPSFRESWRDDFGASIVVFLVALPLCLGIALASGAPLVSGLVTGIVGGIVVGFASGSHLMVSGPAAGLTAIVLTAIATLGSFSAFLTAVVIAGAMQIGLGLLRAGVIGYYFPNAVIRGMLAGIGIIIILKQIPHALGYDADFEGDIFFSQPQGGNTFSGLTEAVSHIEPAALFLSAFSLAILLLWERPFMKRFKIVPGALMTVILGILINGWLTASGSASALGGDHLVVLPIVSNLSELRGALSFPDWSIVSSGAVWTVAVTLAVVASLETLLSLEATDRMDPLRREAPTNRELVAQGFGNMIAGMVGGLPMTGVIVRSSANVYAGGKTKASAIIHGFLLLVAVFMVPTLLNRIPLAVLAAILLHVGWKLANPTQLAYFTKRGFHQWLPFVVTILAILLTDLLRGIVVGLMTALVFILLEHLTAPSFTVVAEGNGITRLRLNQHLTFLSKANLSTRLQQFPPGSSVAIDATEVTRIDHDVAEVLREFRDSAQNRRIDLQIAGLEERLAS